jgi:hypothetical protein
MDAPLIARKRPYRLKSHALNPALQTPSGQVEQMSGFPDESQAPAHCESVEHGTKHA